MTETEQTLWAKIADFTLDEADSNFTFSARLARDNGWAMDYTQRVIIEYKRFIFLCCISENGITPSDAVDQAWHLHLTYTKSYWVEFCGNTLRKEIHHSPTKGGDGEAKKFDSFYSDTRSFYKSKFSMEPPADIWPDNHNRFSDVNFQRVNLRTHRVVKSGVVKAISYLLIGGVVIVAIANTSSDVPYFPLLAVCGLVGFFIYNYVINGNTEPDYNKRGRQNDNGDGCGGDSDASWGGDGHGHHDGHSSHDGGGHGGDSHGCSSGCSGCSSGCSGCGGD